MFDANKDGTIDVAELNDVMKSLGKIKFLEKRYFVKNAQGWSVVLILFKVKNSEAKN